MSTTLSSTAAARVAASNAASERFFAENADAVARACQAMGARFRAGARLLVSGRGAQASDAAHVAVEFLHPVIVGKRALPAFVLHTAALDTLGRDGDILLLLCGSEPERVEHDLLARAGARGMLVLALTGGMPVATSETLNADFHFAVPSGDPLIVQETHEILYHVLWELTHVFLGHGTVMA